MTFFKSIATGDLEDNVTKGLIMNNGGDNYADEEHKPVSANGVKADLFKTEVDELIRLNSTIGLD